MQLFNHLQWWSKYYTHLLHLLQWNDLLLMHVLHKLQKYLCFYGLNYDEQGFLIFSICCNCIESVGLICVALYQKYPTGTNKIIRTVNIIKNWYSTNILFDNIIISTIIDIIKIIGNIWVIGGGKVENPFLFIFYSYYLHLFRLIFILLLLCDNIEED